ncbi:MAG: glycoside hydrolase, partial [Verrucomicrobiota bacterium]|nr:glycoside hydrolase [Verrucomicrobiota bacterium]
MDLRRSFLSTVAAIAFLTAQAPAQSAKVSPPARGVTERDPIPVQRSLVARDTLFPVALRLQDGRIAAVVRSPANHLGIDGRLDIVFSSDEGKTWSKPALIVDTPLDDRDPAFGQAKDGTLVIGYYR